MSIFRLKGASGPVINQTSRLSELTRIGTSADSDVRVPLEGVSGDVAEISNHEGRLTIRRTNSAVEVQVNGEVVDEIALGSGDEIRIGSCRWVLQAPGLKPERVLTQDAVKQGSGAWRWVLLGALSAAAAGAAIAWQQGLLSPWIQ